MGVNFIFVLFKHTILSIFYKLSKLRPEDFPEIPQVQIENSIEISQKDLKNIIKEFPCGSAG